MNLALAIIAYDEKDKLQKILKEYDKYFDEIAIAYDKDEAIQNLEISEKVKLIKYEWNDEEKEIGVPDFSCKRNFLADQIQSPYYFRLDTDDIIDKPDEIKAIFEKMVEMDFDVCYVPYIYGHDQDNNIVAEHWRDTIVKKRPGIYWKKAIHENVFIENQRTFKGMKADQFKLIHDIDNEHAAKASERNFKRLLKEYEQDKENCDIRTISYIGREYMGRGKWPEAIPFLKILVSKSGWDDDRYFGFVQLADCYMSLEDFDTAIACCNEALHINTKFPDAYLKKGEIYLHLKEFDKALDWLMPGLVRPKPDTMIVVDTTVYGYKARLHIALAFLNKGDFGQALDYFKKAQAMAPSDETIKKLESLFHTSYENEQYVKNLLWMTLFVNDKDPNRIQDLLKSIPKPMYQDERICSLKNKFAPVKEWSDNSIVILCGNTFESWADPSVLKGIGGSEEAVIYLSRELTKLGYGVTVFNACGDLQGQFSGVTYRNFFELNRNDKFNIVVSWRMNYLGGLKAKRKVVWLHDVPQPGDFTGDEHLDFDKIIVLSQFHKTFLPKDIPEEKIFVSFNGINLKDFDLKVLPERNPKRLIYTSSYDRGIQHLLLMWPDILKEVPDAELHLFYGWNVYDQFMKEGLRPRDFRVVMQKLMDQPNVFEHGRVGHKQLIQEFYKSGIYVYPCHFEEISCISAMKAQACGCIPVTTDYAALNETVKSGVKIPGKAGGEPVNSAFKAVVLNLLKNPEKQEELRKETFPLKELFGWDKVAESWKQNLFSFKRNIYKDLEEYRKEYDGPEIWKPVNFLSNGEIMVWPRYTAVKDIIKEAGAKVHFDAGCSDGALSIYLAKELKIESDGIEPDVRAMDWANAKAQESNLKCKFHTGLIEEFEPEKKYDTVSMLEVLEHVIDPRKVLDKLESLAVEGGHIILSTPDKNGYFGEKNFNPQHINHYGEKELKELIGENRIIKFFKDNDLFIVVYKNIPREVLCELPLSQ